MMLATRRIHQQLPETRSHEQHLFGDASTLHMLLCVICGNHVSEAGDLLNRPTRLSRTHPLDSGCLRDRSWANDWA